MNLRNALETAKREETDAAAQGKDATVTSIWIQTGLRAIQAA